MKSINKSIKIKIFMNSNILFIVCSMLFSVISFPLMGEGGVDIPIFNLGYGARPMGMAESFTALADDWNASYYNPAGLSFLRKQNFSFMQSKLKTGLEVYLSGFSGKLTDDIGYGMIWSQTTLQNIPVVNGSNYGPTEDIKDVGYASYQSHARISAISTKLTKDLSIGTAASLFYQGFTQGISATSYGYFITPALFYKNSNYTIGVTLHDALSTIYWSNGTTEKALQRLSFGTSTTFQDFVLSAEGSQYLKSGYSPYYSGALEWNALKIIVIRLGVSKDMISAGLSFVIPGISLDYAYMGESSYLLGTNSRISLNLEF